MGVGTRIKDYLSETGISQEFLSRKANISRPKLSLSLNEKRRITFEEYERVCWALGVNTDRFLTPHKPERIPSKEVDASIQETR